MSFLSLLRPVRRELLVTLLCVAFGNLLALLFPWGIKLIIDEVLVRHAPGLLWKIIAFLGAAQVLRSGCSFVQKYQSGVIGERMITELRKRFFSHLQAMPAPSVQALSPARIMTRFTGDIDCIRRFLFGESLDVVFSMVGLVGTAAILFFVNPGLTAITTSVLALFSLFYLAAVPRLKRRHEELRDAHGTLTARVNEALNGIATVRALGGEDTENQHFSTHQAGILRAARQAYLLNSVLWTSGEICTALALLLVLGRGGQDVLAGKMTPGELVAFYSYLGMMVAPVLRAVIIGNAYQEASAAMGRIQAMLAPLPAEAPPLPATPCATTGSMVRFDQVDFGYRPGHRVLHQVSFATAPGETIGIIGPSGAGKTTLMTLLLGFSSPQSGRILLNDTPLDAIHPREYKRQLAVVFQDDFLFHDTVAANITYGRPDLSMKDVIRAARLADAHGFIEQLPAGYNTLVGERGTRLSSGQRQRIAIARALARKPGILILDEATSALDAMTENRVQHAIRADSRERTIFLVAHRFSTIMDADKTAVIEDGRITAFGTHNELMAASAFYRNLYQEQFKPAALAQAPCLLSDEEISCPPSRS